MKRRLFTILSALSLLLFVAVCVVWVWSYVQTPGVVHQRPGRTSFIGAYRGRIIFETAGRIDTPAWPGVAGMAAGLQLDAPRSEKLVIDAPGVAPGITSAALMGFQHYARRSLIVPTAGSVTTIPLWFIAAVLATPQAVLWGMRFRGRDRGRRGLCPSCGYDLRATPEQCPECGHVASSAARPAQ